MFLQYVQPISQRTAPIRGKFFLDAQIVTLAVIMNVFTYDLRCAKRVIMLLILLFTICEYIVFYVYLLKKIQNYKKFMDT